MPGWAKPHDEDSDDSWKLVLFLRSLRPLTTESARSNPPPPRQRTLPAQSPARNATPRSIEHWQKTPMANVVRDPREFPDAILPDLATNTVSKFTKDQVALVYGSLWKQRYFTKMGDDYFPLGAQWYVSQHKVASLFRSAGNRLVGAVLSTGKHATSHRPHLRWLSLRWLRHPHQASRRVERWLRKVSRPRKRTQRSSHGQQYS